MFVLGGMLALGATATSAQSPGTLPAPDEDPPAPSPAPFQWQLQPFCNVVTLTMVQSGNVFRLDGTDDQCGAGGTPASAIGTAFFNTDGTFALGLTLVASPDAAPTHVMARVDGATLNGTWRDSVGNTGMFTLLTPRDSASGDPRPTTATIGAISVNPKEIQLRVSGSCPAGQVMQAVNQDGTVACAANAAGGDITQVLTDPFNGLQGGGASGTLSLGLHRAVSGAFDFTNVHGFVSVYPPPIFNGAHGAIPASGPGVRLMWYPTKRAFRAGEVRGTEWDESNVGDWSTAMGSNPIASGFGSTAIGFGTTASRFGAVALGAGAIASGSQSFAAGLFSTASGTSSVAMGHESTAAGLGSVAIGQYNQALGEGSVALGSQAVSSGSGSFSFADSSTTASFTSFGNQFAVRAVGGSGFYTNPGLTAGVELRPGSSAWLSVSDANLKEHFRDLDDADVLTKIARMPVREWNYKAQDAAIRHLGPTAQDFHAAFGLGEDPLKISTIDADGVALRAIQALEARTRAEHDALIDENRALKAELAALRARLDRLDARRDR